MNQTIGIEFQPNATRLFEVLEAVELRLGRLGSFGQKATSALGESTGSLMQGFQKVSTEIQGITRSASKLGEVLRGLKMPKLTGGDLVPGGKGGSKYFDSLALHMPFYMMGWRAGSEAIKFSKKAIAESLFHKSGDAMLDPEMVLGSMGFSRDKILMAEQMGRKFSYQHPQLGTAKDFMVGISEAMSGLDFPNTRKGITEAGTIAKLGMILEKPLRSAHLSMGQLLSKATAAELQFLSKSERAKYETGELSKADLGARWAQQMINVVTKSHTWGKDFATLFQYDLPSLMMHKANVNEFTGIYGALVSSGQKGMVAARGMRTFMEKSLPKVAAFLEMESNDKLYAQYSKLKGAQRTAALAERGQQLAKEFYIHPIQFLQKLRAQQDLAVKKHGAGVLSQIPVDTQWKPQWNVMMAPGAQERAAKIASSVPSKLPAGQLIEQQARASDAVVGLDSSYKKFGQGMENLWREIDLASQKVPPIVAVTKRIDNILGDVHSKAFIIGEVLSDVAKLLGYITLPFRKIASLLAPIGTYLGTAAASGAGQDKQMWGRSHTVKSPYVFEQEKLWGKINAALHGKITPARPPAGVIPKEVHPYKPGDRAAEGHHRALQEAADQARATWGKRPENLAPAKAEQAPTPQVHVDNHLHVEIDGQPIRAIVRDVIRGDSLAHGEAFGTAFGGN